MSAALGRYRVWDAPTRLFHWTLALLIAAQYASGEFHLLAMRWHYWLGYLTLALLLFRVLWGFAGSQTARFADFLRGPGAVLAYLRGGAAGVGHNPLGGWSVLALLASTALQALSGLAASDDIDETGPLAAHVSEAWVRRATAIHAWNRYVLLALIALHLLAVALYLAHRGQNLIAPMLHGRKTLEADPQLRFASGARALALFLACAVLVSLAMWWATA